jgi:hypothetical protein
MRQFIGLLRHLKLGGQENELFAVLYGEKLPMLRPIKHILDGAPLKNNNGRLL